MAHWPRDDGAVEIVIRGHNLPGRWFRYAAVPVHNVHVAVQVGKEPEGLVAGDALSAEWRVEVRVENGDDGAYDFKGKAVQGGRGERFVYLTWGDVGRDGSFNMIRRAKLMLGDVEPALIEAARSGERPLVATIDLTGDDGGPRCARVRAPALTWSI